MLPEPLSRFPLGSGFSALPSTVDSHLMHTSQHFQYPVSIISVHSATSVPISHSTASRTLPVLSSAVASITPTWPSWGSRLRTFLGFNVCKAKLVRVVTCQRGCFSISKTLQQLYWLPIKWRIDYKVATLTYKLLESGEPTSEIPYHEEDFSTCTKIFSRRQATRTVFIPYENWITCLSLCRTGNMELPAVWH